MKQKLLLKSLFLLCALIVGTASGWADSYTITFATGSGDGTSASTSTACSTIVSEGSSYLSGNLATATKVYYGGSSGLKLGTSSASGTIKMNLASSITPTSIVVNAKRYNAGTAATLKVNGSSAKSLTSSFEDYTFAITSEINYIELVSSKYCWISSITVNYTPAATLTGITVDTPPTKTSYKIDETLDLSGIKVIASYDNETTKDVTSQCTFNPANGSSFNTTGNQNISISYQEKSTTQSITVYGVTALTIKTAPTKIAFKETEQLDLSGLVLTATYSNDETKDITEGFTSSIANGTALTTSNTSVKFTYYGQEVDQAISVGTLSSITYNNSGDGAFANTSYTEKDKFNPSGLVVTAHYSNGIDEVVTGYSLSPDTDTELQTTNDKIVVSYTWAETTKTVDIPIDVNAGTKYTVTFNAQTGTCGTASLTETDYMGGVTMPEASCSKDGWDFAGWATAPVTNTMTAPTLYPTGSTYYPTENTTLYAVYFVKETSDAQFKRVTSLSDVAGANKIVIVDNKNGYVLDHSLTSSKTAPVESSNTITVTDDLVFDIGGDAENGYTFSYTTNATYYIGVSELPTSGSTTKALKMTATNKKWFVVESDFATNTFVISNVNSNNACIDYYSGWKAYYVVNYTNNQYTALKLYVPVVNAAYNSNPTDIVTPTVAFEKGNTTLYLDGTSTYSNAATVTDSNQPVTYKSSNTSVATVDDEGVVTAVSIGEATITASVPAELGVSSAAQATYTVTVKSTTTIAGIKALTSNSTEKSFTADLTNAVVTYVYGNHAYIQDASGAIYVNFENHGLVAENKINGAVSGKVKANNQIDQITELDLSNATVSADGEAPSALVKTLAEIKAAGTDYDGMLVTVNAAKVTNSGSNITDDDGTTSFVLTQPNSNISVSTNEKGNFTGFVSIYNGSTYRLNVYDISQFVKTHNAPQNQTLSFEGGNVVLDEDTPEYDAFAAKTVSGAQGTVTYSITGDAIYSDFNTATGAFTLNGSYGTATITATAAATDVTDANTGIITPYNEATKSYSVTVHPRYSVTFSVNGAESTIRQATYEAAINVPTPTAIGDYKFMGWSETEVDATNDEPTSLEALGSTITPNSNKVYYAVYALATPGGEEEATSTFTVKRSSTPSNPTTISGITWSYNGNVSFVNSSNAGMPDGASISFALPQEALRVISVEITKTGNTWSASNISLPLTDKDNNTITTLNSNSLSYGFTNSNNNVGPYTITANNQSGKIAYIDHIDVSYATIGINYSDYRTSLDQTSVTISTAKYTTFSNSHAVDFSGKGVTIYKAKAKDNVVSLTKVESNIVPANTGVILYKNVDEAETFTVNFTNEAGTAITDNELVATTNRTFVTKTGGAGFNYIMQLGNDNSIVFNMASEAGAYMPAGRAYLSTTVDASATNARLMVVFGDDASGIEGTRTSNENVNGEVYNLKGQRVMNPAKGNLYIVNGKKVFIK